MIVLLHIIAVAGCGEEARILTTTSEQQDEPSHQRLDIAYFKGVTEPGATDWSLLSSDADKLRQYGFNTVTLEPPVLVAARAGGKPRVILEGMAITTPGLIEDVHREGLAVFLAPTTAGPGFSERQEVDDTGLDQLTEDTLSWAEAAEEQQVELFAPLSRCNLVLGTETCRAWLQEVLPAVRERYTGLLAAKVAADIDDAPTAGGQHDFELLDYRGYDYIMIDIHPWGRIYYEERFRAYVEEVLSRAEALVKRDNLKGVIVGDLRLPRNTSGEARLETGTWLNEQQQAEVADMVISISIPGTSGFFFYGWYAAGYGARGYLVEDVLIKHFGGAREEPAPDDGQATTTAAEEGTDTGTNATTIVNNS